MGFVYAKQVFKVYIQGLGLGLSSTKEKNNFRKNIKTSHSYVLWSWDDMTPAEQFF